MRSAWPAVRNVLKAWALLLGLCAALGALGWWIGGLRVALVFGFGGLLVGLGSYWYSDRIVLGMVGAALATVASTYVFAGWQLHMCARVVGVGWTRIFPWRSLGRAGRSAALAGLAAWTAAHAFTASSARLAVGAAVLAVSYGLLLWWTKDAEAIAEARQIVAGAEADDALGGAVNVGHAS